MALRPQASRFPKQRTNKLRRARHSSKQRYRPLLENLEPRMLLAGFWTQFQAANLPNGPTAGVQTSMLLSNGVVLEAQNTAPIFPNVNGGTPPQQTVWFPYSPTANGSYANGTYGLTSTMNNPRLGFPSVMLKDGEIFSIGGEYSPTVGFVNAPEIYNPLTNTWRNVAPIPTPPTQVANSPSVQPISPQSQFGDDPIKILPNGDLLAGWFGGGNTYIYSVATDTWRPTTGAKLHAATSGVLNVQGAIATDPSDEENWTILPDGSILSYDNFASFDQNKFLAQRFDPNQDMWVDASQVDSTNPPDILTGPAEGFELGASMLLNDGRVIVFAPNGHTAYYNSKTGIWSKGPDMPFTTAGGGGPRLLTMEDAPAAELTNGKLLLVASAVGALPPTRILEFDPTTNVFTDVTPPNFPTLTFNNFSFNGQEVFNMLNLPSGQILLTTVIAAGNTNGTQPISGPDYLYTPDGNPQDSWRPTIQSITDNGDGTFKLMGTQLNGLNEGAVFGDDFSMSSNYPLLRLTDSAGNITYARTFNWSNTGVQTGNQIVSTDFTLPPGKTVTDFTSYVVVANGIPSLPFQFSPEAPQTVSGTVFSDTNTDGLRQSSEAGISHITVFLDLNGDGQWNVTEPACVTDFFGRWSFKNVQPGDYIIRVLPSPGIILPAVQTTPGVGAAVSLAFEVSNFERPVTTDSTTGKKLDFGYMTAVDYGDAPDGQTLPNGVVAHYGTLAANNGARHGILPGFHLGAQEDSESNGQPNLTATGDDVVNAATNQVDDEDGITISAMTPGQSAIVTAIASTGGNGAGKLQGWIDWNQNGVFDTNEKVISNWAIGDGAHMMQIQVPPLTAGTKIGATYARFRYGFETDLGPTGSSLAGEVEDYQVMVLPLVPQANSDEFPRPQDLDVANGGQGLIKPTTTNYKLDVLANDIGTANGPLKIVASSVGYTDSSNVFHPGVTSQGGTLTIQNDMTLGHQVLIYNPPSTNTAGGYTDKFQYQVATRFDQGGNPLDESTPANDLIDVSLGDNTAIDDTFTFASDANPFSKKLAVMQNDLTSHPIGGTGGARVIAIDMVTAADLASGNPTAATQINPVTVNGVTLSIDQFDPTLLDVSVPGGFQGSVNFKYTIDESPDDATTGSSTRFVTVQIVDAQVVNATTTTTENLADRQNDPDLIDGLLRDAGYEAELDTSVVGADQNTGDPTDQPTVVHVGDTFYLRVQSHDLRQGGAFSGPQANRGVEIAYLDMLLNHTLVNPSDQSAFNEKTLPIRSFASPQPDPTPDSNPMSAIVYMTNSGFASVYDSAKTGQNGVPGAPKAPEFNEAGGSTGPAQGGVDLSGFPTVFYVRMKANLATTTNGNDQPIQLFGNPADVSQVAVRSDDPNDLSPDVLAHEKVYYGGATLTVKNPGDPEGEFSNLANPADVNMDGQVTPLDVVIVINTLNTTGAHSLVGAPAPANRMMIDTNRDDVLSALDAVKVINYLNSFFGGNLVHASTTSTSGAAGEGESSPTAATASTDLALLSTTNSSTSSNATSTTPGTTLLPTSTPAPSTTATTATPSTTSSSTSTTGQTTSASSDSVDATAADDLFASLSQAKRGSNGRFGAF